MRDASVSAKRDVSVGAKRERHTCSAKPDVSVAPPDSSAPRCCGDAGARSGRRSQRRSVLSVEQRLKSTGSEESAAQREQIGMRHSA